MTLEAEDVDTCPSEEKSYLRGGRASILCLVLGFLKVGRWIGPNCVTNFGPVVLVGFYCIQFLGWARLY